MGSIIGGSYLYHADLLPAPSLSNPIPNTEEVFVTFHQEKFPLETSWLSYTIHNEGAGAVEFGYEYNLAFWDGEQWMTLPFYRWWGFPSISLVLEPGRSFTHGFHLHVHNSEAFAVVPGIYQFRKRINGYDVVTEFEITDSDLQARGGGLPVNFGLEPSPRYRPIGNRWQVFIELEEAKFSVDTGPISFTLVNESEDELHFGNEYSLEFLSLGGWQRIPFISDFSFTDELLVLYPGEQYRSRFDLEVNVTEGFNMMPGLYRLRKRVNGYDVVAEFLLY